MALSYRGGAEGSAINGGNPTMSMPAGIAQDDVVYACGGWATTGADDDLAFSTSGYIELADLFSSDTRAANFIVARKVQGATPDSSVVLTGSGRAAEACAAAAHVWTGANTTTPEDATTTTATGVNGAIPDSPEITTATANAIVLTLGLGTDPTAGDTTVTAPTGYGNQVDINGGADNRSCTVGIASKSIASPAAENPGAWTDWTTGLADAWCAATVALRPAASGNPTGNGSLVSASADIDGSGVSKSAGNGALTSGNASIVGSGKRIDHLGNGSLVSSNASISGSGISKSAGNGNLAAQSAIIAGLGRSLSRGNGSLVAQNAAILGSGSSKSSGNGSLVSGNSSIIGSGKAAFTGSGNLVSGNSSIAGSGRSFSIGNGNVVAGNATIAGSGISKSAGNGSLASGAATIAGSGTSKSLGIGALVAQNVAMAGSGRSISQGNGALVAGNASISGSGTGGTGGEAEAFAPFVYRRVQRMRAQKRRA